MTIFFWADLHIEHENILRLTGRPFRDIGSHDRYMISQINKYVGRNDRIYLLGDLAWRGWPSYRKQIECKNVHIIWGNHDRAGFAKGAETAEDVSEVVLSNGHKAFLSHYAHAYWPSSHRGSFHFYGHTHADREDTLDKVFPARRSQDVGVDNALRLLGEYRPFDEHWLTERMLERPGHDQIEFYQDLQAARNANPLPFIEVP